MLKLLHQHSLARQVRHPMPSASSNKKVAIVQSNYIPWKGYFDLINMVDEFILYDDAQYTKNDWRNRNKILTKDGLIWLTIPVKHNFPQRIKEVIVSDNSWRLKHWRSIQQNYAKANFFDLYREEFESLYLENNEIYLSQINYQFIVLICRILKIKTNISWSMDYQLSTDDRCAKVIELCKQSGANTYLSGESARVYLNQDLFTVEAIGSSGFAVKK